jgi:protein ImuB
MSTVCSQLEAASLGARRLELRAYRVDGQLQTCAIGTNQPVRDASALLRLLVPKLEGIDAGFGFERVVLSVTAAAPFGALQTPLLAGAENEAVADRALVGLIDALESRLGAGRIQRPMPWQAWLPEQAVRARGPFEPHQPDNLAAEAWPTDRPRPLRLFENPEPISVMAPVLDDPPVLFRWRRAIYCIRRADGSERLTPPWWHVPPAKRERVRPRDYYRLEDSDGRRFWVYRDGPMSNDTPASWFIHGIFG